MFLMHKCRHFDILPVKMAMHCHIQDDDTTAVGND